MPSGIVVQSEADERHATGLAVLTGLAAEARLVRSGIVRCAAADPHRARLQMREMIARGARRCLSFGLAGALEPGLPSGSVVIGAQVLSRDGVWPCDAAWRQQLAAVLPMAHVGDVWGTDAIIAQARDKARCYGANRCLIADMESHIVAEAAVAAKLPCAVVRVVCDPAEFDLPPAALLPLCGGGAPDLFAILGNLLRHPSQFGALFRLGGHHCRAVRALAQAVQAL